MQFIMRSLRCSTNTCFLHLRKAASKQQVPSTRNYSLTPCMRGKQEQPTKIPPPRKKKLNLYRGHPVFYVIPVITFSLGTWELYRYYLKKKLIANIEERMKLRTNNLTHVEELVNYPDRIDEMEYTPFRITGWFDHSKEILFGMRSKVENSSLTRSSEGGYNVVTAFQLTSGDRVLVNRGWVPQDKMMPEDRIEGNREGQTTVVGHLRKGKQQAQFNAKVEEDSLEWNYVDVDEFARILNTSPILLDANVESTVSGGSIGGQTVRR